MLASQIANPVRFVSYAIPESPLLVIENLWLKDYNESTIFCSKEVVVVLFRKETGQGLLEYALILVLVAIVVIAAVSLLGPTIGNMFSDINASIPSP
ncbi:MAG: hypothetical protein CVU44_16620 [Chloroflexi bacterium HGW-Chloroflexi-6]|nr:MAG: hypothetical protein CVU44_16620 [Chloroflexi bacterium HGW-Chloroflexi-6]